ncbi:uncharacterized protein LOC131255319 [Magnolia sinica]|uniref:uncharacterized protein LOC131255319 n=1 Tax=Magnolia sinica TaxID=86752 RepID=UPI00265A6B87|nr:uncharacterized protein LOC131255319 [Magnolia sinica]
MGKAVVSSKLLVGFDKVTQSLPVYSFLQQMFLAVALPGWVRCIERSLGLAKSPSTLIYLGVPIAQGRIRCNLFEPLLDKVTSRIQGWNAKILSQGSKLMLISFVLSSILTHSLAATIILKKLLSSLASSFANFFWGWRDGRKKLHWRR